MLDVQLLETLSLADAVVAQRLLSDDLISILHGLIQHASAAVQCKALSTLSSLAFTAENKITLLAKGCILSDVKDIACMGHNDLVRVAAVRVLAVLGQNDLVNLALGKQALIGRGIRVLALDGGGMKGMAEVQMLRSIEARTGRRIHELFDVIGGTSTGCMLAVGCGIMRFTLDEMADVYMGLGKRVFARGVEQTRAAQADSSPAGDGGQASSCDRAVAAAAVAAESGRESWAGSFARVYRTGEQSMRVAMFGAKYSAASFEEHLKEKTRLKDLG
jgi:hypothetical protein